MIRRSMLLKSALALTAVAGMGSAHLGIGMRKGEIKLQGWINGWIQTNTSNGQLVAIHKKFHG